MVWIYNPTDHIIEVVVAIDQIDVLTNRQATKTSRGYLINPNSYFDLKGYQSSENKDQVRTFTFADKKDSHAVRLGNLNKYMGNIQIAYYRGAKVASSNGRGILGTAAGYTQDVPLKYIPFQRDEKPFKVDMLLYDYRRVLVKHGIIKN
jgi:hypothetical protein